MYNLAFAVLIVGILVSIANSIRWKFIAMAYISYMIEKKFPQPSDNEMRERIKYVIENTVNDLFRKT